MTSTSTGVCGVVLSNFFLQLGVCRGVAKGTRPEGGGKERVQGVTVGSPGRSGVSYHSEYLR